MTGPMLAAAACAILLSLMGAFRAPRWWLATLLASTLTVLAAAAWVLTSGGAWEWRSAFLIGGERLHLRLDGVSALFLALLAVMGGAGAAYSREYWADQAHPASARLGRWWWSALLLCMGLLLVCSNGLHFLIAWELFALCAFFLITLDARRREVRAAGWLYLAASHAGTLALFAFFSLLAARTGSWDLGRFGIQFVASPRHADGLLITGPVTKNMELALQKTYTAVPEPKIVIAVGACAIAGGPFVGHPHVHNGAGALVPADLFIPGCPPHPLTILDGLLRLLGRLEASERKS